MCFNETASWVAFAFGCAAILAGAIALDSPTNWAMFFALFWLLQMQVSDALSWRYNRHSVFASKYGYIANITQPVVVFLLLIVVDRVPSSSPPAFLPWEKAGACALIFLYLVIILARLPGGPSIRSVALSSSKRLNYSYWDTLSGVAYLTTLLGVILLLLRPLSLALVISGYIFVTFIGLLIVYHRDNGSLPSVWCFVAVGLCVLAYAVQADPRFRT